MRLSNLNIKKINLDEIDKNYPDAVTEDNVDAIIQQALKKKAAEAEHEN